MAWISHLSFVIGIEESTKDTNNVKIYPISYYVGWRQLAFLFKKVDNDLEFNSFKAYSYSSFKIYSTYYLSYDYLSDYEYAIF